MTAHDKLCHHAGDAQQQDADGIDEDEGCTTILAGHVGETPYVAQANSRTGRGEHDAYLGSEITAFCRHVISH